LTPLFTIVVSITGALLVSIAGPFATFRLNERQRRLELYKIAYPEKFKAIREFMATAYNLQIEAINEPNQQQSGLQNHSLIEKIKCLKREADANRWLFGEDVVEAVGEVCSLMKDIGFHHGQASSDIQLSKAFDQLSLRVEDELHMSMLRKTFLVTPRWPKLFNIHRWISRKHPNR